MAQQRPPTSSHGCRVIPAGSKNITITLDEDTAAWAILH
jgi:hypothetical protein